MMNAPKLRTNLLEISRFLLEQLSIVFPKINVYYQPMSQTIKCQMAIREYGSSK